MMKNTTTLTLSAIVIVAVIIGVYFFLLKETSFAPNIQNTISVIDNTQDLDKVNDELDEEQDFNTLDTSLSQLETDAQGL